MRRDADPGNALPSRVGAPNDEGAYRLGVLGAGGVFQRLHHPALQGHPRWQVRRIHDPAGERAERARALFPGAAIASGLEDMLGAGDIDAVLVLTPPSSHADLAVACLEGGVAVLVEKPLAPDVEGAEAVVAAWRRAGRPVLVGYNRRHRGPYLALRSASTNARPRSIEMTLIGDARRWSRDPAGDDLLDDLGCHALDLVPWMARRRLREVRAIAGPDGRSLELSATLEGGFPAHIRVGRGREYVEWVAVSTDTGTRFAHAGGVLPGWASPARLRRTVAKAGAVADSVVARLVRRPTHTRRSLVKQLSDLAMRLDGSAGLGGADPLDGLRAVHAVEACRESLRSEGRAVAVPAGEPDRRSPDQEEEW